MTILTSQTIDNLLGHGRECWNFDYPTGKNLEKAFYLSLAALHQDVKLLGSTQTIVDVGMGQTAFELKGSKSLGFVKKLTKSANNEKNSFIQCEVNGLGNMFVRIPHSIMTMCRRPKVDLNNFQGDPKQVIEALIEDYNSFALDSCSKGGFTQLRSGIMLYGQDTKKGIRAVAYSDYEFADPKIVDYSISYKRDGKTPNSYQAIGEDGLVVFQAASFNKGSSNFFKRYYLNPQNMTIFAWPMEEKNHKIYDREELSFYGTVI